METTLRVRFDKLQDGLLALIRQLDALDEIQLHARPEGAWSAVQVLYHLMISEGSSVKYLNKKLDDQTFRPESAGVMSMIRSYLLRRALTNRTIKYKAPSIVADIPDKPDYPATRDGYLAVRRDLEQTLERFDRKMMGKNYFKHPRAGKMSIVHALDFMKDHFDRHRDQMMLRAGL